MNNLGQKQAGQGLGKVLGKDLEKTIGDLAGNVGRDTNTWTLTIITNAAYSFDDARSVTEIAYNSNLLVRTLGWDDQYQLLAVSNGTSEVESYTYDPFGRRLTTTQGTNTVTHLYDGIHCIADLDSSGDLVRSYTYGPGIDSPLAMTVYGAETNTYYYLTNHLGSVLALTDEDGQLVESYQYDAFGRIKVFDSNFEEIPESAYGNRITFQGREYSWATGLYYFRARWYEPVTGRWLSKDPIGISGGLNQYEAFASNPVRYRDPDGLDVWIEKASGSEPDLHISVNVGDPNGRYYSQSFGTDLELLPLGAPYQDVEKGGKMTRYTKSTPTQDELIEQFLRDDRKNLPTEYYGPTTCRTYSHDMFDQIVRDHGLTESKAPKRKNTPRTWYRRLVSVTSSPTQGSSTTTSSSNSGSSR